MIDQKNITSSQNKNTANTKLFNSILFPTDFSICSKNAFKMANTICEKLNIPIYLKHYYEFSSIQRLPELVEKQGLKIKAVREEEMEEFLKDVHKSRKTMAKNSVEQGSIQDLISDYVHHNEDTLIVMGTTGQENSILNFGTNASRVAFNVDAPVLVVPLLADVSKVEKLIFLEDYESTDSNEINISNVLALKLNAALTILHFKEVDDYEKNYRTLNYEVIKRNLYKSENVDFINLNGHGSKLDHIKEYLKENRHVILAINKRNRNAENFKSTLMYHILTELNVPALIF